MRLRETVRLKTELHARVHRPGLRLVWEARLSLPDPVARRPLPLLDAQGARKNRLETTEDELGLYREWIENNRELERLVKEMRRVLRGCLPSSPAGRLHEPPRLRSRATVALTLLLQMLRPVR